MHEKPDVMAILVIVMILLIFFYWIGVRKDVHLINFYGCLRVADPDAFALVIGFLFL